MARIVGPAFIYATGAVGLALLPAVWTHSRWDDPAAVAALCATAVPPALLGINVRGRILYAYMGPELTAYVFFGPAPAALVRMTVELVSALRSRRPFYKVWFNLGQIVISTTGAHLGICLLGLAHAGAPPGSSIHHPGLLLGVALLLAGLRMGINIALVDLAMYLRGELPSPWTSFRPGTDEFRWQVLMAVVTIPLGIVFCGLYLAWGLLGAVLVTLLTAATGWLMNRQWQLVEETRLLQEQASRDPLTGLFNRARMMDLLHESLMRCARAGQPLSLLFIDLDGFGEFNNRYGHLNGDRLLARVAGLLEEATGGRGKVARYAGDEFVVVLPGAGRNAAEAVTAEICDALETRVGEDSWVSPAPPSLTCSVGIASYPEDGNDALVLLQVADQRMYAVKGRSRARPVVVETAPRPARRSRVRTDRRAVRSPYRLNRSPKRSAGGNPNRSPNRRAEGSPKRSRGTISDPS
ncbi:MAG TPA: GGDEF domain-containing protein, partial [Bacillota bacterium]